MTRPAGLWAGAALALALASGAGLLLARLLMNPPASDLREMALYLALSGAATMGAGWLALRAADRAVGLTLYMKAFLSAAIGSGVGLLNVLIVARGMFLSTAHDLRLLIALVVFSGVVTVFFSLWVASSIAGRIGLVASGVSTLAAGQYGARVPLEGRDEVARLARDVNDLAARLETAAAARAAVERERHELTAAISHDLRTPLASVRAMVEALDDRVVDDPNEVTRYYGTMRREIERLDRMIDDLFELARLDAGVLQLERRPLALQEIAAEVVDAMQAQARRHGVTLSLAVVGQPAEAALDGARIERVIGNLVRNALEHTPAGGQIEVRVAEEPGALMLSVTDTGEGIGTADLPRIWERFYRAEPSRGRGLRAGDGAGLGLAIVRGIVQAHGGEVKAASAPGQGTTFTVRLPWQGGAVSPAAAR